jgi:RimJ/RimL family protein N-acetyltransferase
LRVRRAEGALGLRDGPEIDVTALFGLRLRTERLELRLPDDDELPALAHLAEEGIHPPETMPFEVAWTDGVGKTGFVEGFLGFHHGLLDAWRADKWEVAFAVFDVATGEPMGVQGVSGERFAPARRIVTGSWLGPRFQGRGFGTDMRSAVLDFAFAGLGAEVAVSGHADGNLQSMRVSQKLGYEKVSEQYIEPRGYPILQHMLELPRERWAVSERIPVGIAGLVACLPLFGLPNYPA